MPTFLILGSKLQAKAQALGLYSISEQFEHFLVFVLFSTKKYHFDWNVIKFSKCIVFMSPYVHLYSFIITLIAFELIVCFFKGTVLNVYFLSAIVFTQIIMQNTIAFNCINLEPAGTNYILELLIYTQTHVLWYDNRPESKFKKYFDVLLIFHSTNHL